MYRCCNCGREFEDYITWKESRGEYWGVPCYETMCGSPCCKDGFEDVIEDEEDEDDEYE